jgi:DNA-binding response OmpR family regulator
MMETKASLLIVEDDLDVADMLDAYFRVQGYTVFTAYLGEEAVTSCRLNRPDLLILDIRLPDIDGYEVARRLRSNRRTDDIPIIFLTEKRARADRLQGLELGADDYITKPFDIQELRLRVRNTLRRAQHNALVNPVTNLPEGALVDERLDECLGSRSWALLGITLENLDAFREMYGFVASDDVLRAISLMIHNAVREIGNPSDFIGQVSPTDFLLVTTPAALPALTERIRSRLDQAVDYFYPLKDRGEGAHALEGALRQDRLHVNLRQVQGLQKDFSDTNELKSELFAYGRR